MSDHLTPEELFEFIDQGGSSGPVGRHLLICPECLWLLDDILLCEAPATAAEDRLLDELPEVTAEDLLERLRERARRSA